MKRRYYIITIYLISIVQNSYADSYIFINDEINDTREMTIIGYNKGMKEECNISVNSKNEIIQTTCIESQNNKKVKTFCTKSKKICKPITVVKEKRYLSYAGKYNEKYSLCLVRVNEYINNMSVHICSKTIASEVMNRIETVYKKIYDNILQDSKDDAKKFEYSQKSWVKYRNVHCKLMGDYVGSPEYSYCPMELNINRLHALEVLANQ